MEKKNTNKRLSEYNRIIKKNDELYHNMAKNFGMPDCAFWILYMLREEKKYLTQCSICDALYQPKQTVNSALKKLEKDGYITLEGTGGRNGKQINLTVKGIGLASQTVDRVIDLEKKALGGLTIEEQKTFLSLFNKYTDLLETNMQELL